MNDKIYPLNSNSKPSYNNGKWYDLLMIGNQAYGVITTFTEKDNNEGEIFIELCPGDDLPNLTLLLTHKLDLTLLTVFCFATYKQYVEYCNVHETEPVEESKYNVMVEDVPIAEIVHYILDVKKYPFLVEFIEKLHTATLDELPYDRYTTTVSQLGDSASRADNASEIMSELREMFYGIIRNSNARRKKEWVVSAYLLLSAGLLCRLIFLIFTCYPFLQRYNSLYVNGRTMIMTGP